MNIYSKDCLDRFVVKSEWAVITIPEIQLEIPKTTQKGSIKTVEGFLRATADGLALNQEERRLVDPDTALKIDEFIEKLERMCEGEDMPYHFKIDDPSGNSYIQNPHAPANDVYVTTTNYKRSKKQLAEMGFVDNDQVDDEEEAKGEFQKVDVPKEVKKNEFSMKETEDMIKLASKHSKTEDVEEEKEMLTPAGVDFAKSIDEQSKQVGNINNEAISLPMQCFQCGMIGIQKSCISNIPHFKEIIIMAFNCEFCGERSVEVKQGGGISEKARKITLSVEDERDLYRDLYKGDTCEVRIPELDFSLAAGTLGGIYTTVEGLLTKVHNKLEEANPFAAGDSAMNDKFKKFLAALEKLKQGEVKFTLILDDPLSNNYIYSELAPDPDPRLVIEDYERTFEQNEDLGINDMKVD